MKVKCLNWHKINFPLSFRISGYNEKNQKCTIQVVNYENEVFIEVSQKNFNQQDLEIFLTFLERNSITTNRSRCCLKEKKTLYGYLPIFCFDIFIKKGFIRKTLIDPPFQYKIINEDIDERVKFCTDRSIKFCRWVELRNFETTDTTDIVTYKCSWDQIFNVRDDDPVNDIEISPTIFYFDIECEELKNEDDEDDDQETIAADNIIQISIVCQRGKDIFIYLLSLFPIDEKNISPDGYENYQVKVEFCKSQKSLLLKFFGILNQEDPDIISGYNILEFDWKRIISISNKVNVSEEIYKKYISRSKNTEVRWISKTWESSAYQKKEFFYPEIEGRSNLDIIQHVKRNYPLPSYSLNNVVKHFLEDRSKMDVDYKVIKIVSKFARECYSAKAPKIEQLRKKISELRPYRFYDIIDQLVEDLTSSHTIEEFFSCMVKPITVIGKYCIVDSLLCLELMDKLQILSACEEIANCTYVTLEDTLCRGNQYRVFNLLYNKCYFKNIVMNKPEGMFEMFNNKLRGILSGALVLDPKCGHHRGVITLDFASLYPNIIINYNLCYTTFSLTPTETTMAIKTREGEYFFEKVREGILPQLEKELIEQRKLVKRQLKLETRPFKRQTLDSRQNALKITANSMYGSLAAEGGKRLLVPAAACITSIGRELLDKVRYIVADKGFEVIYGDTDSNIIKLPTSTTPFVVHDSRIFSEHLVKTLEKRAINYEYKSGIFYFENEEAKSILEKEYDINISGNELNVGSELENRAATIGRQLAKEVTNEINIKAGTNFDLEYENCFQHYLLIGKKYYIGKKYSGELIKKGVISVKRIYADIEKRIFDAVAEAIFSSDSIREVTGTFVDELQRIYTNSHLHEYIITTSFKSLRNYASKIDTGIYINKNGERFVTKEKLHPEMYFDKLPINAMIALKMYNRGEMCPENSRLEYVFYCNTELEDKKTVNKGEMAVDFVYFFRNKEFLKINKLTYLQRLVNPIDKIIDTSGLALYPTPSLYVIHQKLSSKFNIRVPSLTDIITIKSSNRKFAISEVQDVLLNLNITYEELNDSSDKIKAYLKDEEKISVSLDKKPIEVFESKLLKECRRVIQQGSPDYGLISMCSTINSNYVMKRLYEKYGIRKVSKKRGGICSNIVDVYKIKSKVIKELYESFSIFKKNGFLEVEKNGNPS
jgi:DNA polymerase elongation subunit (family B)